MARKSQSTNVQLTGWQRNFSWLLITGGLLGSLASFILTLDKVRVSVGESTLVDCNLNPVLSCVSVMQSTQSELFGFPNQIIGLIAFPVLITLGVLMRLAPAGFKRIVWQLLSVGALLGWVLIHWMISQSLYVIGALCLWCMLTWVAVAAVAWYSLLFALHEGHIALPARYRAVKDFVLANHLTLLLFWYLIVIFLVGEKFWYYWETLL